MAKRLSLLLILMLFGGVANVYAESFLMLKNARDLPQNGVLVLMAEVQDCSFCIRVKEEHLLPLTKKKSGQNSFTCGELI